ncbi:MAG TPA: LysR family transcriptional regulator [Burkholderiaceae bacterium]
MRITLRQLEVFTAVADAGSTTAAGERIALSQSATSAALKELEHLLGARLFDRVGTRLALNDTGRAVLAQARVVLDGAAGIEREFGQGVRGAKASAAAPLRVGASTTIGNYLLPGLIASWLKAAPGARVDVRIGNTAETAAAVVRLDVDLAFIEGPAHEPELRLERWREDELVVVAAPSHPLVRAGGRLGVAALREVPWLLREPGSGTREAVEQALLAHLREPREGMQFGGTEAIKQAAASGLGFACLSIATVRELIALKKLVRVETTLPRLTRPLYLARHRAKRFSPTLERFVAHCR